MSELNNLDVILNAKRVDLSHEVSADIVRFAAFDALEEKTLFTIDEDGFYAKEYIIATQYGTHIDAPGHFAEGKRLLETISADELILSLYVLHFEKEVDENNDFAVTAQHIKDYEAENGDIPAGSFVAFSSDWSKRFDDAEAYHNEDTDGVSHTPGWSIEALKYLAEEKAVKAIGHETLDTDSGIDYAKNGGLEAEYYWLSTNNYQVEVLNNLSQLLTTGAAIVVAPVNLKGAPGLSSRVFALIP